MKPFAIFAVVTLLAGSALAAPCRDAKGKFMKCPPVVTSPNVTKDAKGHCHVGSGPKKGQFTKCP